MRLRHASGSSTCPYGNRADRLVARMCVHLSKHAEITMSHRRCHQHRIHTALDHAGEMHAEEREIGIVKGVRQRPERAEHITGAVTRR